MKRKRSAHAGGRPPKRTRDADQSAIATPTPVDHPVLQRLYPEILSLRHYLLARLPSSSKNRRRKISQFGVSSSPGQDATATCSSHVDSDGVDVELGRLLDSTLVGVSPKATTTRADDPAKEAREKDIQTFSQQLSDHSTGCTFQPGGFLQGETVNFVIWLLFKKSSAHRPLHLLCHGFQRASQRGQNGLKLSAAQCIPGIVSHSPNTYVDTLKGPLWHRLRSLLGPGGDRMMMDLLLDCGIFYRIDSRPSNFYQLSGTPVSELRHAPVADDNRKAPKTTSGKQSILTREIRNPGEITFVRNRMLYARAALNAKGGVRFGMRHIHVLNRFPNLKDEEQTIHIMRYIFPRQFGLHNVFISQVDSRETSMQFKDYTLREREIQQTMHRDLTKLGTTEEQIRRRKSHIPKRLRGETVVLIDRLRKLNQKCAYMELLRHYCPVEGLHLSPGPGWRRNPLQPIVAVHADARSAQSDKGNNVSKMQSRTVEQVCFTDMACPAAHVSAFCRAVIGNVIPNGFWGDEDNKRTVMYWIDQFINLRRFESLTLHQVTQKLQISNLAWLRPPGHNPTSRMAKSDFDKRREILLEFVYWVFDSFLVPLIRSNFHVTESNVHRNRLFYFRHDVWRMLTEPSITSIKLNMFEEMPVDRATKLLSTRTLGFSKIRLLPKSTGVRLITNLRRKQQTMRNGVMVLGRSINTVMAPVFNVLTYERSLQPDLFGSSLFSVGDMFPKLQGYKQSLQELGLAEAPLYFAKVDVQSCFDTIPQKRLLSMMENLLSMEEYQTGKYVEMRPLGQLQRLKGKHANPPPLKRYIQHSRAAGDAASFERLVQDRFVGAKSNTVFIDTAMQHFETRDDLMQLLQEHVERNLVKIGKRFYRQKTGIPQGSILSSILCNFFYAELEREALCFAQGAGSLLLRLLDDFCLITTRREHAERFVQVMHRGNSNYGVFVKPAKSLTNFDMMTESGYRVSRCSSERHFPYCGVLIDTCTLEVSKNNERAGAANITDSLTVDLSKVPGQTFHRRVLNAFKIQLQDMFIDTSFNTVPTVLGNLYASFLDSAVRCFEYIRCLSKTRPVHPRFLINTVESIIALAFAMLQRRTRTKSSQNAERIRRLVPRRQIQWLACKAFTAAFQRKQTQHHTLLAWLRSSLAAVRPSGSAERCMLEDAISWRAASGGSDGRGRVKKAAR